MVIVGLHIQKAFININKHVFDVLQKFTFTLHSSHSHFYTVRRTSKGGGGRPTSGLCRRSRMCGLCRTGRNDLPAVMMDPSSREFLESRCKRYGLWPSSGVLAYPCSSMSWQADSGASSKPGYSRVNRSFRVQ